MSEKSQRIALYGGAFDPFTTSHEKVVSHLLGTDVVDAVWLLPTFTHSYAKKMTSFEHRMAIGSIMAARFNCTTEKVVICDFESTYETGGQTYPSLVKFLEQYGKSNLQFYFVIGLDNAITIHAWDDWDKLIQLLPFIVFPRVGSETSIQSAWFLSPPHVFLSDFVANDGSATQARQELKEKRTSSLVSPDILEYIHKHNLYQ
jgi:nicotinate-nucleotide adenylyltransferase